MTYGELIIALQSFPENETATVEGVELTISILHIGENVTINITQKKQGEFVIIGNRRILASWWKEQKKI